MKKTSGFKKFAKSPAGLLTIALAIVLAFVPIDPTDALDLGTPIIEGAVAILTTIQRYSK